MKLLSFTTLSHHSIIIFLLLQLHLLQAKTQFTNQTSKAFPALIIFGDSIVDPGNNNNLPTLVKSNFPPYGKNYYGQKPTGRFSNGKIPTDFLASGLGIKELLPAYLDPNLQESDLLTGVSFASAGAGFDNLTAQLVSVLTLWDQLELFKEYIAKVKAAVGEERASQLVSHSLYGICAGSDDLVNTYYPTPLRKSHYTLPMYMDLMERSASSFIQELYGLGARKMAILGLPPLGCIPSQRTVAGGITRECVPSYNQAASTFNAKLSNKLKSLTTSLPGSKLVFIDDYSIFLKIIHNPHSYGFEEISKGCCGTGTVEVSVLCNKLTPTVCSDVSKYVFWDSYHPTEKAYKILATQVIDKYLSQLL